MPKIRLNEPNIHRPSSLGNPSETTAVVAFALGSILAAGWLGSEYVAWQLDWNPMLGGWRHYYAPWSFVLWELQVEAPIPRLLHHAYAIYPSVVTNNLHAAWYVFLVTFLGLWSASVLLYRAFRSSRATDNQFDSGGQWATETIARKDNLLDGNAGPIIGGFATHTRTIRPMRYAGELGISYTEPPGGGKSSFLKTNLLIPLARIPAPPTADERRIDPWGEEPLVIVSDPKFELFRETSGYQKDVLHKQVLLLAPLGISETTIAKDRHQIACYNPFWSIRLGTDHAYSDCERLCQAIIDGDGKGSDTHWDRTAKAWGAACIEKLGYRAINQGNPEIFSLPGLVDYLSSFPSQDELLQDMLTTPDDPLGLLGWVETTATGKSVSTHVKPSIMQAVREMQNKDIRERSGVYSTFITYLSPYRSEMLRKFVMRSTFDWLELANNEDHASIVYISMDPMEIPRLRPYLRMVTSNAIMQLTSRGTTSLNGRSVRTNFRPTVIALDEVAAWRKMPELEHGSGFFRGYGVYLWLIWQSVAQQKKYYGSERLFDETMAECLNKNETTWREKYLSRPQG
jgi:hypothetical protein